MGNFCHSNEVQMNTLTFQQVHVCRFFSCPCGKYTAVSLQLASSASSGTKQRAGFCPLDSTNADRKASFQKGTILIEWCKLLIAEEQTDSMETSTVWKPGVKPYFSGTISKNPPQPTSEMPGILLETFIISITVNKLSCGGKSSATLQH